MAIPLRVLIVEDSLDDTDLVVRELKQGGFEPIYKRVETRQDMQKALESEPWDLVLSDYYMPRFDALQALSVLKGTGLDLPFILVSGSAGEETAVDAMRAGIHDYIFKHNLHRLCPAIQRELSEARFRSERRQAREALHRSYAELERRVDERTEELRLANSRLAREIEDHARAAQALRASEGRLRSLFSAMNEGFVLLDLTRLKNNHASDAIIIEVNAAFERLVQMPADNLIGKSLKELFPTVEQTWLDSFATAAFTGEPTRFESYSTSFEKWFEVSVFCPEKGQCAAVLTDTTERKQAEAMLALSNQRVNEILGSIQDDFCALDRNWRFIFASKSFTSKLDKEPQDLIGNSIWEVFPRHVGTAFEENLRATMEAREIRRFEVRGQYTDAWYRMTVFPSPEGITFLGTDITERVRTEQQIQRQMKELAELNDDLGRFNRLAVGRELRMIELKQEVNDLCAQLGQPPRYGAETETRNEPIARPKSGTEADRDTVSTSGTPPHSEVPEGGPEAATTRSVPSEQRRIHTEDRHER